MSHTLQLAARLVLQPAVARELSSLASAAVLYPFGLSEATNAGLLRVLSVGATPARVVTTPVVLVHGYGGNRSNWLPLQERLGVAGYLNVHATQYNPLTTDLPSIAARLVEDCQNAMRLAGAERVHVVGHSLGGVVLRYAATRLGLGAHLATAVTIAAPHGGSPFARLGRGSVAADLRPGSRLLHEIAETTVAGTATWTCYWSDCDWLVAPGSAQLPGLPPTVVTVPVPGEGHVSILRSPALLNDVVGRLLDADGELEYSGPGLPPSTALPAAAQLALAA